MEQRAADMRRLFAPMVAGTVAVCENYSDAELTLIVDFMRRCGQMGEARIQALRELIELPAPTRADSSEPEPNAPPSPAQVGEKSQKAPRKSPTATGTTATLRKR
jgi:hypothetical protein